MSRIAQRSRKLPVLIAAAASVAIVQFARANVATWDGGAATNLFGGANWTTNGLAGYSLQLTGDSLVFDAAGPTGLSNDLTGATFNGITFSTASQALVLDGNAITLGGNLVNNNGTFGQVINFGMNLSATRTGTIIFGGTLTLNGVLSGPGGFIKDGPGRLVLTNANTFAGPLTTLGNGTTILDFSATGAPANNIIAPTTPLVFGTSGGSIVINGSAAGNSQTFAGMTVVDNGYAGIGAVSNGGAVTVDVGNITRGSRSLIHFGIPSSGSLLATGLPAPVNGILGGWATANGTGYATTIGNQVVPYTGYTDVASGAVPTGATSNVRLTAAGGFSTSNVTLNTLLISNGGAAATTITNTGALKFANGGGLFNAQAIFTNTGTVTINGGSITAGTGSAPADVYLLSNGSFGNIAIQIASILADNGPNGTLSVIKGGNSVIRLTSANTYTGGTYVNQGRLETTNIGAFGTGSINIQNGAGLWFNVAGTANNALNINTIGLAEGNIYRGSIRTISGTVLAGPINLLSDGRVLLRSASGTGTVSGVMSGVGGMEFGAPNDGNNVGTTILAAGVGANSYAGNSLITGGTTKLGAADQIPNGAGKGDVVLNSAPSATTLDLNGFNETINGLSSTGANTITVKSDPAATLSVGDNNASSTYGGAFGGSGLSVNKIGGGVFTITGNGHTYNGNTIVTAGTLQLGASANINSSRVVDVRSGGTFDVSLVGGGYSVPASQILSGSGVVRGAVTMSDSNATIAAGPVGSAGTLTFNDGLTLSGGTLRVDLSNATTVGGGVNDLVQVNGNLSLNGATSLSINRTGGSLVNGTYRLMQYSGTLNGAATNLQVPQNVRQTLTVTAAGGNVNLGVSGTAPLSLTWSGGNNSNAWDLNNTANFNTGAEKFFNWDSVTFNDSGSNSPNVNLSTTLEPENITLANTTAKSYQFDNGQLNNVSNLNKTGNGIATFNTGALNRITNVTASGGGTLVMQNQNNIASLTVNAGTFMLLGNGTIGSTAVGSGGNFIIGNDTNGTFTAAGTVASGGRVVLTGQATFSAGGLTLANGASLTVGNGVDGGRGQITGTVTNNGTMIFSRPDNYTTDVVMAGTGVLRKQTAGEATFSGVSSAFTGSAIIEAGRVWITNSNALGSTADGAGSVTVNSGASVDLSNAGAANNINFGRRQFFVIGAGDGSGVLRNDNATNGQQNAFQLITLTGDATFGGGGRFDMRAAQVGGVNQATLTLNNNTLTKTGAGSFILVNTSVTDGNINLSQGIMQFESTTSIPASATGKTITMAGGTTLQFFTLTGDVSRQINTSGDVAMAVNTSNAPASTLASPITLGGNLTFGIAANNSGTLILAGNIAETGGARSVTKNNNGTGTTTVVLSGNNSYTGNTNVSGGTLRVNGTHTAASPIGDYSVSGSATFGGSSSNINAKIIMNGGSNLSPGANTATVGTLNVGTLSLDGTNLQYDIEASGADKTNVTTSGGLLLGGGANQFTFASANPAAVANGTYSLIDYSGSALADLSKFSITNATGLGSLNFTLVNNTAGTSIDLTVTGGVSVSNSTWNVDASGNWSVAGNWAGGVPNSIDATANLGTVITAPRTVTVDSAQTVGTINFSSPNSYTIGGASVLSLDVSTGAAAINVTAGSHTISAPVTLNDNLTVTSSASSGVALTGALTATGKTITKAGAGTVQFENVRAAALNVSAGSAKISAKGTPNSAAGTSVVSSLTIASGANLDLTNNSAVIDYTGPVGTLVGDVRQHLQSGRLSSSSADANRKLGYGDNAILNKSTFAGQSVDTSSVLIKYTYAGDANLDGQVDVTDLGSLATNWQTSNVWTGGDFNYDGFVDVSDLGSLATNWQAGVGSPLGRQSFEDAMAAVGLGNVSVPEPACIGLISLGVTSVLARRRKNRANQVR